MRGLRRKEFLCAVLAIALLWPLDFQVAPISLRKKNPLRDFLGDIAGNVQGLMLRIALDKRERELDLLICGCSVGVDDSLDGNLKSIVELVVVLHLVLERHIDESFSVFDQLKRLDKRSTELEDENNMIVGLVVPRAFFEWSDETKLRVGGL